MRRTRIGAAAVLCLFAAAMLTALAGTHVTPPSVTAQTRVAAPPDGGGPATRRRPPPATSSTTKRVNPTGKNTRILALVVTIAVGLFVLAAAYALIHVLAGLLRDLRPRGRYARRSTPRREAPPISVPPALRRAVDAGIEGLRADTASSTDAIIAAWLALRDAAAGSGVASRPTDTPEDLVRRVLGRWAVRSDALTTLAELYREARFSQHRLGDAERAAALAALEAVRADLADPVAAAHA